MIFVDSNLFVIALRYPRDRNAKDNAACLRRIAKRGDGVTSVINVLEVCGILSFNLNDRQLRALYTYFGRRFGVRIIPEDREARPLLPAIAAEVLTLVASRMSFGDALVADALRRWAPAADRFVSWDAQHFQGKIAAPAVTPREFLRGRREGGATG